MANLKISQLEEYTGSPIGTYLVVDNPNQDATYKILRSNFLRPSEDFRVTYGVFSQTGNSESVSGTTSETTIINGGVGTLTVGANQFTVGDSFRAIIGGEISAGNNQTIRLRVESNGSTLLLDSGPQTITNITNDVFYLTLDFSVRSIGGPGIASIVTIGNFKYSKTVNGSVQGFAFNTVNDTTFDTTIDNTLDVTVQWGSTNTSNSFMTDIFTLTKVY